MKGKEFANLSELAKMVDWEKVAQEVIEKQRAQEQTKPRKETDVKRLYQVYVIDPKTDEILVDGQSDIAKSEETAKFHVLSELDRDPDELVVRATCLFPVPSPDD